MQNLKSISVCESRVKVTAPGASPAPLYPGKPQKFCEYFNSVESVLPASVCEQYTVLVFFLSSSWSFGKAAFSEFILLPNWLKAEVINEIINT